MSEQDLLTPLVTRRAGCTHPTPCPAADAADCDAAMPIAGFMADGWSLLCNGNIIFADTGEIRLPCDPAGVPLKDAPPIVVDPHRPRVKPETVGVNGVRSSELRDHLSLASDPARYKQHLQALASAAA